MAVCRSAALLLLLLSQLVVILCSQYVIAKTPNHFKPMQPWDEDLILRDPYDDLIETRPLDEQVPEDESVPLAAEEGAPPQQRRRPKHYLYQGDMLLSRKQMLAFKGQKEGRKMAPPDNFWTRNKAGKLVIPYAIGDKHANKTLVDQAIKHWAKHTCASFNFTTPPKTDPYMIMIPPTEPPYMNFVGNSGSCRTYVGSDVMLEGPHNIFVGAYCEYNAYVHEIGHTFGMQHEHSRHDRDKSIKILWENIVDGAEGQFTKEQTNSYNVPYDYYSNMHFNAISFSTAAGPAIRAISPIYQSLMGSEEGLTFMDAKIFNIAYKCTDDWVKLCSNKDPCKNGGYIRHYPAAKPQCACVCPAGSSGTNCEKLLMPYNDAILATKSPYSKVITSPGKITTPGFPKAYPITMYTNVIKAPACKRVVLVMDQFLIMKRSEGSKKCEYDSLEVRLNEELKAGQMYCGSDLKKGQRVVSEKSTLILHFLTYWGAYEDTYKYEATVSFEAIPNCS